MSCRDNSVGGFPIPACLWIPFQDPLAKPTCLNHALVTEEGYHVITSTNVCVKRIATLKMNTAKYAGGIGKTF